MSIRTHLEEILIPRPNGSQNLEGIADHLASSLAEQGATVTEHLFTATPHGFQIMWIAAVIIMAVYSWAVLQKRYRLAIALPALLALALFVEFEYLVSTFSLLSTLTERNIIGSWLGTANAPTLIFTAHYDTATHFGDHFSWGLWGQLQGPATGLAILLPVIGLLLQRKGKSLPKALTCLLLPLAAAPFIAMFWFQSIGPLVRTPSVGAIDNGGAMAVLLQLAEEMKQRPANTGVNVKIVFLAAEEERTLGSWAYAKSLVDDKQFNIKNTFVINLESIGTTDKLAYIPEDGFATRRFKSSAEIIAFSNQAAQKVYGEALLSRPLPFGTLTDGRSFLAHGIQTITLRSLEEDEFPHHLHSEYDSIDRLSIPGLEKSVELLKVMISDTNNDATASPAQTLPN